MEQPPPEKCVLWHSWIFVFLGAMLNHACWLSCGLKDAKAPSRGCIRIKQQHKQQNRNWKISIAIAIAIWIGNGSHIRFRLHLQLCPGKAMRGPRGQREIDVSDVALPRISCSLALGPFGKINSNKAAATAAAAATGILILSKRSAE